MCKPLPKTYTELIDRLYEPFDILDIKLMPKWKGAGSWNPFRDPPKGFYLTNLDAQAVKTRLNECFGIDGWDFEDSYEQKGKEILCTGKLIVRFEGEDRSFEKTIPSHGSSSTSKDLADVYKSARTAAISKAASELGIGDEIFRGRVNHPVWIARCKKAGITNMKQWNDNGLVITDTCGPAKQPASKSSNNTSRNNPANPKQNGGSNPSKPQGNYKLTEQLYKVAQMLKLGNNTLMAVTRKALKLAEDVTLPRLVDIKDVKQQKTMLAYIMKTAAYKLKQDNAAESWLKTNGCNSYGVFAKRAAAGEFGLKHIEGFYKALIESNELNQENQNPQDNAALDELAYSPTTWKWQQCLQAYSSRGIRKTELESLHDDKPLGNFSTDELTNLQLAYQEILESGENPRDILGLGGEHV